MITLQECKELINSLPFPPNLFENVKDLIEGVEIDLDEPLNPEDE